MLITREISSPKREYSSWEDRWRGADLGLITTWERGIEMREEGNPAVVPLQNGELPVMAWKGGVEGKIIGSKTGSMYYLAMRQGILNLDLSIDTDSEVTLTCSRTGVKVIYAFDSSK